MTKRSPPPVERAFTVIEVLVVMAIIAILAAILIPSLNSALERAKVTKDMSNLRQIGAATQMYMNDNTGVLFSTTGSWMSQLYNADNPAASKYLSSWKIFVSPFDKRTSSAPSTTSAISYGINGTAGVVGMSADRISKPTVFVVFAPAQKSGNTVGFQGTANTTSQAVLASSAPITVVGIGGGQATSVPGGNAQGGTNNGRTRVSAVFADWHAENMPWGGTGAAFTNNTATANDPDGANRWSP